MSGIPHLPYQPSSPGPGVVPQAEALRRRRRARQSLSAILRIAATLNDDLGRHLEMLPDSVLDELSTASVSLEACVRALKRSAQSGDGGP